MHDDNRAESDFWIGESLKVLEVAIHNTRFYVGDAGRSEQVAELLTLIADIPPLVRQRALSPNGTRRLGYIVERANQIMRDIEQGIRRTPPEPTFWGRLRQVKQGFRQAWGCSSDAVRTHNGRMTDAHRMQEGCRSGSMLAARA